MEDIFSYDTREDEAIENFQLMRDALRILYTQANRQ